MADLQVISRVYGPETWDVYELLDQSINPRGPDCMHDVAGEFLSPDALVLDVGCRDAAHLIKLVRSSGAHGVGVDPVEVLIEQAIAAVEAAGMGERIEIVQGVMQDLDYPDDHFDLVWCRDVVELVDPLGPALRETVRVLKPGGRMLVYTDFVSDRLEPEEAAMLSRNLVNVPANLIESNVEAAFTEAGLTVERKDIIGTEWREYAEERTKPTSQAVLRLARLRRQRETIVAKVGQDIYDHIEVNLHRLAFQFLGKLQPTLYVLGKAVESSDDRYRPPARIA